MMRAALAMLLLALGQGAHALTPTPSVPVLFDDGPPVNDGAFGAPGVVDRSAERATIWTCDADAPVGADLWCRAR